MKHFHPQNHHHCPHGSVVRQQLLPVPALVYVRKRPSTSLLGPSEWHNCSSLSELRSDDREKQRQQSHNGTAMMKKEQPSSGAWREEDFDFRWADRGKDRPQPSHSCFKLLEPFHHWIQTLVSAGQRPDAANGLFASGPLGCRQYTQQHHAMAFEFLDDNHPRYSREEMIDSSSHHSCGDDESGLFGVHYVDTRPYWKESPVECDLHTDAAIAAGECYPEQGEKVCTTDTVQSPGKSPPDGTSPRSPVSVTALREPTRTILISS